MRKKILNIGEILNTVQQKEIYGGLSREEEEGACSNECFLTGFNPCGDPIIIREKYIILVG